MGEAIYEISGTEGSWRVLQSGEAGEGTASMSYPTKEGAFEAAVLAATNAIRDGHGVTVRVAGLEQGSTTLGNERVQGT